MIGNRCAKQTTLAIILTADGELFAGCNECDNPKNACPRGDLPSGVGYDLCNSVCKIKHHAEVGAILAAKEKAKGSSLYLFGHTYCCDNCKSVMTEAGVKIAYSMPDMRIIFTNKSGDSK